MASPKVSSKTAPNVITASSLVCAQIVFITSLVSRSLSVSPDATMWTTTPRAGRRFAPSSSGHDCLLGRLGDAVVAGVLGRAHHRHAGLADSRADVLEVDVDHSRHGDDDGDPGHRLAHYLGGGERLLLRDIIPLDFFERLSRTMMSESTHRAGASKPFVKRGAIVGDGWQGKECAPAYGAGRPPSAT